MPWRLRRLPGVSCTIFSQKGFATGGNGWCSSRPGVVHPDTSHVHQSSSMNSQRTITLGHVNAGLFAGSSRFACSRRLETRVTSCLHIVTLTRWLMPTSPNRTKKALQELARVFNKLASDLTADLNEAVREIESLKKEVQRIKSSPSRVGKSSYGPKKSSPRGTRLAGASHSGTSRTGTSHTSETPHETSKTSHETSSFVFPHEPFNPPAPPEPAAPGNN